MVNNLSSFFSPQELDEVLTTTREKGMLLFMITTFKDKETEKIYHQIFSKKLPIDIQHVVLRKLIMLNNAKTLEDLRIPPSNHLEKLSGDRAGQYSIRINKQFRLCFSFHLAEARNVEIVDYH